MAGMVVVVGAARQPEQAEQAEQNASVIHRA